MANTMLFPPKDGKGPGRLWTKDAGHICRVDFDGFRFGKVDGGYHLMFLASACSAFNKNDEFKFPGVFEAHIDTDSNNPGYVLLASFLDELDPEKCYSGFMEIEANMKAAAKALTKPEFTAMLKDDIIGVMEVECPEELKTFSPKAPRKGGYSKSKSRSEIAAERFEALQTLQPKWEDIDAGFSSMLGEPMTKDQKLRVILALIA